MYSLDHTILSGFKKAAVPAARVALFVIFFWFGILKLLGLSPAEPLVEMLFNQTIPFISFPLFYAAFSLFECILGILFLIPKATRLTLPLLFLHMFTTLLPLIFLPQLTWQAFLVPTLSGQYIIKNLALIALALCVGASAEPIEKI